jgi:hypothetical protein
MRNSTIKLSAVGALSLSAIALVGCGGGSIESLSASTTSQSTPQVAAKANAVTISVVDAATGSNIKSSVKLSLGGELAGKINDASGNVVTTLSTTSGVASFYTDATGNLQVTAVASGYLSSGSSIQLTGSSAILTISLTSATNPPATVAAVQQQVATVAGMVNQTVTVSDSATDSANAESQLTIPDSTTLKTAAGVALNGPVTVSVASYDISKLAAQEAMPGSFVLTSSTGSAQPLSVAAVANIEITDASGDVATTFSQPLNLRLDVASTAINAAKGRAYAVGDTVSVLSYSSSIGAWASEGSVALQQDSIGLYAQLSIPHLTTWAVGQPIADNCNQPIHFTFTRLNGLNVGLSLTNANLGWGASYSTAGQTSLDAVGVPVGQALTLNLTFNGQPVNSLKSQTYTCGETVTLNDTIPTTFATHTFAVNTVCNDGTGTPAHSEGLVISLNSGSSLYTTGKTDTAGNAVIAGLVSKNSYSYELDYNSTPYTGTISGDNGSTAINIPVSCPKVTGASGRAGAVTGASSL